MSYITFNNLGSSADLGSQLQQYASMYAVAKETNKNIVFFDSDFNNQSRWGIKYPILLDQGVYIIPDYYSSDFQNIYQSDGVLVDQNVFNLKEEVNYRFTNLFHLYHYWYPKYKDDIFNLEFNKGFENEANKLLSEIQDEKELVSIHVRRGDYLAHSNFCKLDLDYYIPAMEMFDKNKVKFVVFSNDIQWCKDNFKTDANIIFLDMHTDYVDLILMSKCHHNIIANSSFSWWAAFFNKNKNKKVICPRNYVRGNDPIYSFMNGNYYLQDWLPINNSIT